MEKKYSGLLFMVYALLLLAFAYLWHFALPHDGDIENYGNMMMDTRWGMINGIGWLGVFCGIFGCIIAFNALKGRVRLLGKTGFILVIISFLIHLCLLSWEVFIWPVIVDHQDSAVLIVEGLFFKSVGVVLIYSLFSVTFSLGFLLLGVALIREKLNAKPSVIMMMFGALVYSLAVAFDGYIGLVSFTVYLIGVFLIGYSNFKFSRYADH